MAENILITFYYHDIIEISHILIYMYFSEYRPFPERPSGTLINFCNNVRLICLYKLDKEVHFDEIYISIHIFMLKSEILKKVRKLTF